MKTTKIESPGAVVADGLFKGFTVRAKQHPSFLLLSDPNRNTEPVWIPRSLNLPINFEVPVKPFQPGDTVHTTIGKRLGTIEMMSSDQNFAVLKWLDTEGDDSVKSKFYLADITQLVHPEGCPC